jgi:hypothetical protein
MIGLGSIFNCIGDARKVIRAWIHERGYPSKVGNSDSCRYSVFCPEENCPFIISCFKRKDELVHIHKFNIEHTCGAILNGKKPSVRSAYVVDAMTDKIQDDLSVRPRTMQNMLRRENGVDVPYITAWRGKTKTLESVMTDLDSSFGLIRPFLSKIEVRMPGSYTAFSVDNEGQNEGRKDINSSNNKSLNNIKTIRPVIIVYSSSSIATQYGI